MKIVKLVASCIGFAVVLFSNTSCKKDNECCVYTFQSQSQTFCEENESDWSGFGSWDAFKDYIENYGGDCD